MKVQKLFFYLIMVLAAVIPLGIGLKLLQLLILASILNGVVVLPVWPNICDAILLVMCGLFWIIMTFYKWFKYEVRR